ncbi:acyl carrier protein [Streptomyces sp. ISL-22]|uniref:acyl carrier protein n=1 Tax=Streptomyces TaxID=1883 RepID=UPI000AAB1ACA|nr:MULTISPECIES: acyl carrier protein [Streptomyces]MBT2418892.1 acyl carrier protein [Streptomyces sp. ISL-24]MBT2435675.1 acyl carrier protein [Streptomyces sp. ISL-22]
MTVSPDVSATGIRRSVEEIVSTVLERDGVDPAVDLFDQGVTSLAFIRIVAQLNEKYAITLDVAELEEASIDALAALVDTQTAGKDH